MFAYVYNLDFCSFFFVSFLSNTLAIRFMSCFTNGFIADKSKGVIAATDAIKAVETTTEGLGIY